MDYVLPSVVCTVGPKVERYVVEARHLGGVPEPASTRASQLLGVVHRGEGAKGKGAIGAPIACDRVAAASR